MEPLLNKEVQGQLKAILDGMQEAVTIEFFADGTSPGGAEIGQFLSEIRDLTDKITLVVNPMPEAAARAEALGVVRMPGFTMLDARGQAQGIYFYGLPAGHEINSFIYALMGVSGQKEELPPAVAEQVRALQSGINIKVFVTLSCPHCPGAVSKAHRLAMENDLIKAEMIDANLFPELSDQFQVSSVPQIVFNDGASLIGNQPVEAFLQAMQGTQN